MTILTSKDYEAKKHAFLNEASDWRVETSAMDEYGRYVKTYVCDNGNVLTEVNRPVYETAEVEVKGIKTSVQVKLFESEMFSNKWQSVYMYDKY
jgi:hypothetical protein